MQDLNSINNLFTQIEKARVLVIGDVMIDSYLWGQVDRISPEAPVPVVDVKSRENRLGGAANVALNIQSLGATPILCSVIGDDIKGREFLALMKNSGLSDELICTSANRITTTKFRVFGNTMQMLRVDEEIKDLLDDKDQNCLLQKVKQSILNHDVDVILFQDYDKGVLNQEIINEITDLANENNIPTVVDPKKNNFLHYKNVTLFKPNLKELREGLNLELSATDKDSIVRATGKLEEVLANKLTLITLSEEGVFIKYKDSNKKVCNQFIPAHKRAISDVSGAGDTVVSVAALCLAINLDPVKLAQVSNLAGGLVCEIAGVSPIDKNRLKEEIIKILSNEQN